MTFRLLLSFGLIAGMDYASCLRSAPGMIEDLYVYRQRYDDQQHGIQRKKEECYDY